MRPRTSPPGSSASPPAGSSFGPNPHRFAAFHVLRRADTAAVLFEAGYISNADDELLLRSPERRARWRSRSRRRSRRMSPPRPPLTPSSGTPNTLDARSNEIRALVRPDLPMPDLVAFNRRVHERIDPWWQNKWVRRVTWAGARAVRFVRGDVDLFRRRPALVADVARLSAAASDQRPRLRRQAGPDLRPRAAGRAVATTNIRRWWSTPSSRPRTRISSPTRRRLHRADRRRVRLYASRASTGGGRAKGGSTITQQVAKYLLRDSSYNIGRKAREAILAFRLEIHAAASSKSSSFTSIRSSLAATLMASRPRPAPISTRMSVS